MAEKLTTWQKAELLAQAGFPLHGYSPGEEYDDHHAPHPDRRSVREGQQPRSGGSSELPRSPAPTGGRAHEEYDDHHAPHPDQRSVREGRQPRSGGSPELPRSPAPTGGRAHEEYDAPPPDDGDAPPPPRALGGDYPAPPTAPPAQAPPPSQAPPPAALIKACDVDYEPPRWLLSPYFQRGKGTLIQADNGTGKTAFMCAIAAHVSTGRPLRGIAVQTPGDVLILSVEDDLPILRGRIEANGADLARCHFATNAAGLTFNAPQVEQWVRQVGAKLVIFDPFQAFLGASVNMDKSNQTRPELAKLFEMADRNDCAVAIVAHIGKGSGANSAVNRTLGSVDIPAAMRSILHLARNPNDPNECVAVHVKCSNAPVGRGLSFCIGERGGIAWNELSSLTLEQLTTPPKHDEPAVPYEREPLVQLFNQLLADRPGGGFWPYAQARRRGIEVLGFPPFADARDLAQKLKGPLAKELMERDGVVVTWGHRGTRDRGLRIEQYQGPDGCQAKTITPQEHVR